ncbi:TetR/AcrR family transcriptional regulator [Paenibacillus rhizovicinus]|uniref:TetR/AcrR family transcriptional regulator n=1 Tax=Paenibacillus rhizovicinus TaxID=2704463 RepID=A0A6C0NTV3_9BACL|nr:TetR/AcrR family transcriptional regulator [Paenibacillus rhizovicinus]QHW29650.1 TetR/AcrR family transcriptional regulator [Paenibacillus rhizovicinus]
MEKKETAKERILRVADELFYREGVRAVGIDRIIQESGVAKASFYRNFATKDDLVVAYLELHRERMMGHIEHARQQYPDSVLAQLRYLVEYIGQRMLRPAYRGCAFMNTAVEFPETDHPSHMKALLSRNDVWDHVEEMANEAGLPKPRELAEQLRMLWSGAAMVAYINKAEFKPALFSDAANALIDSQLAAAAT